VPGRPDESKATPVDRLERDPRREERCLPRRLRGDRVRVELERPVDRGQKIEMGGRVYPQELLDRRASPDGLTAQRRYALRSLRVRPRGMQPGERAVGQGLDTASSRRPASTARPSSSAAAAPAAQSGT